MVLRWGIAGAGKISTQFAKSVSILPPDEHQVVAAASQNLERAQAFAKELDIPRAYGEYKKLAEDGNIDVVYVGNLNTQHLEVSKLMLNHGKHVLCEKPLTLNEKQTKELLQVAQDNKKFLMEAVWSRCFPAYEQLRRLIKSGTIGEVLYVTATFGRPISQVERIGSKELGGGTILDLGIYALQFVQFIYEGAEPTSVTAKGHLNEDGVDLSSTTILTYSNGRTAVVTSHSQVDLPNEGVIVGTKGTIRVPRFWCPSTIITPSDTLNFELPDTKNIQFKNVYSCGMSYEISEVGNCIKAGALESSKITHKETLQLAQLMDKIRKGVGVVFNEDD